MDLTEAWLRRHATAGSFERAEAYYQEQRIERLTREGDVYYAEVRGSKPYRQVVDLSGAAPEMTCTCPYRSSGHCKHLIAVGLAILDGKYKKKQTEPQPESSQAVPPAELDRLWARATEGQKISFLRQAIAKQPYLQQAWLRYLAAEPSPTLRVDLKRLRGDVVQALAGIELAFLTDEDLTLEPLSDEPSWDLGEASLLPQIEQAFTPVREELSRWRQAADWPNALLVLLGWYEGIQEALLQRPDEWEGWQDSLWQLYYRSFHHLVDALSQDLIAFPTSKWMLGRLLERWDQHEQALNPAKPHLSVRYHLADWSLLVGVLLQDEITARFLDTRLQAYGLHSEVPEDWARLIGRWLG